MRSVKNYHYENPMILEYCKKDTFLRQSLITYDTFKMLLFLSVRLKRVETWKKQEAPFLHTEAAMLVY